MFCEEVFAIIDNLVIVFLII